MEEIKVKILLIGDSGCGKRELLFNFTKENLNEDKINVLGVDFKEKSIRIYNRIVNL